MKLRTEQTFKNINDKLQKIELKVNGSLKNYKTKWIIKLFKLFFFLE